MNSQPSPIEAYLGDLFDQLSGLGVAGRQLLVETEDHLRCAVADLEASGTDRTVAERRAVERMGLPAQIAGQLRSSVMLPWRALLARLFGAAWLIAVVGLVSLGVSGVLAAGAAQVWGRSAIVSDAPNAPIPAARCQYFLEYYPQADGSCWKASVAHHYEEELRNRLAGGVLGVVAGVAFVAARHSRRLTRLRSLTEMPPNDVVGATAATLFGLAALVAIGQGIDDFAIGRPWGAWSTIVTGVALLPPGTWFAYRTLLAVRHAGTPPVDGDRHVDARTPTLGQVDGDRHTSTGRPGRVSHP